MFYYMIHINDARSKMIPSWLWHGLCLSYAAATASRPPSWISILKIEGCDRKVGNKYVVSHSMTSNDVHLESIFQTKEKILGFGIGPCQLGRPPSLISTWGKIHDAIEYSDTRTLLKIWSITGQYETAIHHTSWLTTWPLVKNVLLPIQVVRIGSSIVSILIQMAAGSFRGQRRDMDWWRQQEEEEEEGEKEEERRRRNWMKMLQKWPSGAGGKLDPDRRSSLLTQYQRQQIPHHGILFNQGEVKKIVITNHHLVASRIKALNSL